MSSKSLLIRKASAKQTVVLRDCGIFWVYSFKFGYAVLEERNVHLINCKESEQPVSIRYALLWFFAIITRSTNGFTILTMSVIYISINATVWNLHNPTCWKTITMNRYYWRIIIIWTASWETVPSDMCTQRRLRSDCASAQSDQSLHWAHREKLHH